ncbi:MAG: hypothetical protein KAH31_10920 [Candidatus Sabulitectum sp.]|nr:hypothetical protein [Candidatus Sabulitectum sp.]
MSLIIFALVLSAFSFKPTEDPSKSNALQFFINGFVGYGMSNFELDEAVGDLDQASYIPGGLQFLYLAGSNFRVGAETEICLSEFKCEDSRNNNELEVSLNMIGLVVQYFPAEAFFLRGGVGSYSGSGEYYDDYYGSTGKGDIESGLGFNLGAGYITNVSNNFYGGIEGIYHIASLELDDSSDTGSYDFNHWSARVFFGIAF